MPRIRLTLPPSRIDDGQSRTVRWQASVRPAPTAFGRQRRRRRPGEVAGLRSRRSDSVHCREATAAAGTKEGDPSAVGRPGVSSGPLRRFGESLQRRAVVAGDEEVPRRGVKGGPLAVEATSRSFELRRRFLPRPSTSVLPLPSLRATTSDPSPPRSAPSSRQLPDALSRRSGRPATSGERDPRARRVPVARPRL